MENLSLWAGKTSDDLPDSSYQHISSSSITLNNSEAEFTSPLIAGVSKTNNSATNSSVVAHKPINKHSLSLPEKCTVPISSPVSGSYSNLPTGGSAFLGIPSPGQAQRKTSDVVKERVANLGVIPETPHHSSSSIPPVTLNWKWIKTSRDILSEEEILRHLEPLRRSQSDFAMSERSRSNNLTPRNTTTDVFDPEAPGTPASTSIDKDDSPIVNFKRQPQEANRPKTSTSSYKRKRDWTKKRNPFVGVIGRSASVRTDNSKSGYHFSSVISQDMDDAVPKCDSTPSLNNLSYDLNRNMSAKQSEPSSYRRAGSFSSALTSRNSYSGKRSCVIDEPLVSAPLMTRQLTAASLTAETAELLGTPTPVEFEARVFRSH